MALGIGEFSSRAGEEFFCGSGVQRGDGGAADCESVVVQRGAVFRVGFWRRVDSGGGWGFGCDCALLSLGWGCGDAGCAAVLPDAAIWSDDVCVHSVAFDCDFASAG